MNCLLLSIARSAYSAVWNDTCMKQMLIRYPYLQAQITAMVNLCLFCIQKHGIGRLWKHGGAVIQQDRVCLKIYIYSR